VEDIERLRVVEEEELRSLMKSQEVSQWKF
jgi:hypothetical protein